MSGISHCAAWLHWMQRYTDFPLTHRHNSENEKRNGLFTTKSFRRTLSNMERCQTSVVVLPLFFLPLWSGGEKGGFMCVYAASTACGVKPVTPHEQPHYLGRLSRIRHLHHTTSAAYTSGSSVRGSRAVSKFGLNQEEVNKIAKQCSAKREGLGTETTHPRRMRILRRRPRMTGREFLDGRMYKLKGERKKSPAISGG